jgi:xanthine dehydrogenase/oxidase
VVVKPCGVEVGAAVTLTRLEEVLRSEMSSRPSSETSGFKAVVEQLRWFAGRQIRNVGTLGGNICTASPISDLNPLWMAMGASFVVVGQGGKERQVRKKGQGGGGRERGRREGRYKARV